MEKRRTVPAMHYEDLIRQFSENHLSTETMYDFVWGFAKRQGLVETQKALPYALRLHEGQLRLGPNKTPYICHPLLITCQAIALGIWEDAFLAAALLHDVCEDCSVQPEELPVSSEIQETVRSMSRTYDLSCGRTEESERAYYRNIYGNRIAAVIKLLDRCSNVSDMVSGFPPQKVRGYILDTETFVYPLFEHAAELCPEYAGAVFTLKYHMWSVIETAKKFLELAENHI